MIAGPFHFLLVYLQEATPTGWIDLVLEKPIHLVVIVGLAFAVWVLWRNGQKKDQALAKANERAHMAHVQMLQQLNDFQIKVLDRIDDIKDVIRK